MDNPVGFENHETQSSSGFLPLVHPKPIKTSPKTHSNLGLCNWNDIIGSLVWGKYISIDWGICVLPDTDLNSTNCT